jgi:hypothetical protein
MELISIAIGIAALFFGLLCLLLPVFVWRIAENTAKATRQNEHIIKEIRRLNSALQECIHE